MSGSATERAGAAAGRMGGAWRSMPAERRVAGAAALALFVSMFLPWYQKNASVGGSRQLVSVDLTAFAVFSFVEGAVLVIAAGVLALLFLRAERRAFHLPGGDGTIVTIAGAWATVLIVWRLFDKPGVSGGERFANVGIEWGIVFALVAAGALAYAGLRMRAAHRPEPPLGPRTVRPRSTRADHGPAPAPDSPHGDGDRAPQTDATEPLREPRRARRRSERPPATADDTSDLLRAAWRPPEPRGRSQARSDDATEPLDEPRPSRRPPTPEPDEDLTVRLPDHRPRR